MGLDYRVGYLGPVLCPSLQVGFGQGAGQPVGRAARRPPHPPWPTAAHRRTKRISSSLTQLPQEPTVSGTQQRKTPPKCGGILSWRNAIISAGIWPGHCLGAPQEGPTAPPQPQQQEPRLTAPCAWGRAWGRARGVPGSRSSPPRLLPPSVPVRELAGRSSLDGALQPGKQQHPGKEPEKESTEGKNARATLQGCL